MHALREWYGLAETSTCVRTAQESATRATSHARLGRCIEAWRAYRTSATQLRQLTTQATGLVTRLREGCGVRSWRQAVGRTREASETRLRLRSIGQSHAAAAALQLGVRCWALRACHATETRSQRAAAICFAGRRAQEGGLLLWRERARARRALLDTFRHATRRSPPGAGRRASTLPTAVHSSCCGTFNDLAIFMRAMVARRAWRERREAMEQMRDHAKWLSATRQASMCAAASRRRRAVASALAHWRMLSARSAEQRRQRGLPIQPARLLALGWRRWRAVAVVRHARVMRALAAAELAQRRRLRRGLEAVVLAYVASVEARAGGAAVQMGQADTGILPSLQRL